MNNFSKLLFIVSGVALLCASCQKDALEVYEGPNNVYFSLKKWPGVITSEVEYGGVTYSFNSVAPITEAVPSLTKSFTEVPGQDKWTVLVPVSLMGRVAGHDRDFSYKILPTSTAVEGVDYKILRAFIPAGKAMGGFLVELNRENVKAEGAQLAVDLELLPDDTFQTNYRHIATNASNPQDTVDLRTFQLIFQGSFSPPVRWSTMSSYYGLFSEKKLFILINVIGLAMEEIYSSSPTLNLMPAYGGMLKRYLAQKQLEGDPVYEADGVTLMTAGAMAI